MLLLGEADVMLKSKSFRRNGETKMEKWGVKKHREHLDFFSVSPNPP